jgi:hypothetical protein
MHQRQHDDGQQQGAKKAHRSNRDSAALDAARHVTIPQSGGGTGALQPRHAIYFARRK